MSRRGSTMGPEQAAAQRARAKDIIGRKDAARTGLDQRRRRPGLRAGVVPVHDDVPRVRAVDEEDAAAGALMDAVAQKMTVWAI